MNIRILEEKKDRFLVEINEGPSITLNVLKDELWNDSHVKIVGTHQEHPLLRRDKLVIETDGHPARKSISSTITRIQKDLEKATESLKGLR